MLYRNDRDMKKIAVIILNWNGEGMLREYLPSIVSHTPAGIADVIVADNGSPTLHCNILLIHFPISEYSLSGRISDLPKDTTKLSTAYATNMNMSCC